VEKLDLHGVRHSEVERLVENFVLLNEPPLTIVCGNSDKMKELVRNKLDWIYDNHGVGWQLWNHNTYKIL
jgi:predicted 3-demethylubiquinone-9 3-methyltransferase (glyoxalase superfamily)|tara:strand:- start:84 stop:293 length:210 start_codon:yes stop_codon:yes gene_type:complete